MHLERIYIYVYFNNNKKKTMGNAVKFHFK